MAIIINNIGPRKEEQSLSQQAHFIAHNILKVRDTVGFKTDNVFFLRKRNDPDNPDNVIIDRRQVLPTPKVEITRRHQSMEAGIAQNSEAVLRGISKVSFITEELFTSGITRVENFWEIKGEAYVTISIVDRNTVFDIYLSRYLAFDTGQPEGERLYLDDGSVLGLSSKDFLGI